MVTIINNVKMITDNIYKLKITTTSKDIYF